MKQSINLYQPILFPVKHTYTLSRLLLALTGLIVLTVVVWGGLSFKLTAIQQKIVTEEQRVGQQQQSVDVYQQVIQQRKPDAAVVKRFEQAKAEVVKLQQLQQYLTQRQQQSGQFYSPVLQHLDVINLPSLWLTSFQLQQDRTEFAGIALQPVNVTIWLEQLRQLDYFKGQHFSQMTLAQIPDETAVSFVLKAQNEKKI